MHGEALRPSKCIVVEAIVESSIGECGLILFVLAGFAADGVP